MRAMKSKLTSQKGVTLVEAVAAAGVLAVLALMLHTGLSMAHRSYQQVTSQAESRLLLSTLTDLLTRELRFARDVTLLPDGTLDYYTSISYGRRTVLSLDDQGQLLANGRRMLSTGAYGNGTGQIENYKITYEDGVFHVELQVSGVTGENQATSFSVRCLNGDRGEGGSI